MKNAFVYVLLIVFSVGWTWGQDSDLPSHRRKPPQDTKSNQKVSFDPEKLAQMNDEDLMELFLSYRSLRLHPEAVGIGECLLERDLPQQQRINLFLTMAKSYESIPGEWAGPETRLHYQRFLDEYPDASCANEMALRLGELYDHIIRPGTKPNRTKAKVLFQGIVKTYERQKDEDKKMDMVILRAYIHLGNIHAQQRNYDLASTCYKTIYNAESSRIESTRQERKKTMKDFERLRKMAVNNLIHNCIRSSKDESLSAFEQLESEFAEDVDFMEILRPIKQDYLKRQSRREKQLRSITDEPRED